MTKFLGIILASIFSIIVVIQVGHIQAQETETPLTGPLTSPLTSPLTTLSQTITPTPTLINTVSSTPTPAVVIPTAIPTATPIPSNYKQLGGLNLEGYCFAEKNPWDGVKNGIWYCGNGSTLINMTAACTWQYGTNAIAFQDVPNNAYSWSCYAPEVAATSTPTVTPMITVLPTATLTPAPTEMITLTSADIASHNPHHGNGEFHFSSFFFPRDFYFYVFLNAVEFFAEPRVYRFNKHIKKNKNTLAAKTCSVHDKN